MSPKYDDIITALTVSSSSPWSETNETVREIRDIFACLIDKIYVTDPS